MSSSRGGTLLSAGGEEAPELAELPEPEQRMQSSECGGKVTTDYS